MVARVWFGLALLVPFSCVNAQQPAVWRLVPDVRIGEAQKFARVSAIIPAANGSVVIADDGRLRIRAFDRAGVYSHSFGADRGYSELDLPRSLGFLGDTLWVLDRNSILFFSSDGKRVSSASSFYNPYLISLLPSGRALGMSNSRLGFRDERTPLLLTTRKGEMPDTLTWLPNKNANLFLPRPDGSATIGRQRFSDAALTIASPTASVFFVVDRSVATAPTNAAFRVIAYKSTGDTLWNRVYSYVPKRLEKARADSLWNALEPVLLRAGHTPEAIRGGVFVPDYYPPVTSGVAGSDGSLWLRREESELMVDYWILNAEGALVATTSVPAAVTLLAITDQEAWGVQADPTTEPIVTRYRIERSEPRRYEL